MRLPLAPSTLLGGSLSANFSGGFVGMIKALLLLSLVGACFLGPVDLECFLSWPIHLNLAKELTWMNGSPQEEGFGRSFIAVR